MRVALYTRVSTQNKGQETANQLLQLRECCHAQNLSIIVEYEDHESGGKIRTHCISANVARCGGKKV